jgi:hypothetical protein
MAQLASADHSRERETTPRMSSSRKSQQRSKKWQGPELANEAMESTLIKVFAAFGKCKHEDDLEHGGGDGQHVGFEYGEVQSSESKAQVGLDWGLGYVCNLRHRAGC